MAAEISRAQQLSIRLEHSPDSAEYYFVPHSGVRDALDGLRRNLSEFTESGGFRPIHLHSSPGLGKTHLLSIIRADAERSGVMESVSIFDDPIRDAIAEDDIARTYIAAFEHAKSRGGIVIFASESLPENPHIRSRLLSSERFSLAPPREEELQPLVISLCERHNLKLTESNVEYLLERTSANPLSLSLILGKIDDLSLTQGRPARRAVLREILNEEQ